MLQVIFTTETDTIKPLALTLNIDDTFNATNYVLISDGSPIGLCRLKVGKTIEIAAFGVVSPFDTHEIKDFFFRTVLFKLSFNPFMVFVSVVDERLTKFGFNEVGNGMALLSTNVKFPSECGKN